MTILTLLALSEGTHCCIVIDLQLYKLCINIVHFELKYRAAVSICEV